MARVAPYRSEGPWLDHSSTNQCALTSHIVELSKIESELVLATQVESFV